MVVQLIAEVLSHHEIIILSRQFSCFFLLKGIMDHFLLRGKSCQVGRALRRSNPGGTSILREIALARGEEQRLKMSGLGLIKHPEGYFIRLDSILLHSCEELGRRIR